MTPNHSLQPTSTTDGYIVGTSWSVRQPANYSLKRPLRRAALLSCGTPQRPLNSSVRLLGNNFRRQLNAYRPVLV
jgi:hypothetical protein